MRTLLAYVEQKNRWNAIFKARQFDINDPLDRQAIADMISSDLSPENLTCDGELSRAKVAAKHRQLVATARELKKMDPRVRFYEEV